MATLIEPNTAPFEKADVDPITLDLIENGLVSARGQMDALLFRTAMSPIIREQRDGFPVITDRRGRLVAGQFGSPVKGFMDLYDGEIEEGDIMLTSDPYACKGSISHANDWLVCMPIFKDGRLINWSAMFGHMTDIGGKVPGSMPVDSVDLYEEGIVIPPVKIFSKGKLQTDVMKIILHNCRVPQWNESDFNAIVAACRAGGNRCLEMADRYGVDVFVSALEELLDRNRRSMRHLIRTTVPERKVSFEDYVCDDGLGMGPYRIACDMWREGDRMIFDFGRTDPQSLGCINLLLSDQMFKMFCGQFMVMMFDPDILLNDGFFDLMEVRIPDGTLLAPRRPAALNGRTHALGRIFDIISGLFGSANPDYLCAAGFSSSPHFMYSGLDENEKWFLFFQIGFGGIPGKPSGDGPDGHSLWPKFINIPNEFVESYFPVRIEVSETIPDSGGPGQHRGGNGMRVGYRFLRPGRVSIHDDRWFTYPWGVKGGQPGQRSRKTLIRADGSETLLPAKCDNVMVDAGDYVLFETWGGGGWGNPLERDLDAVIHDLESGLITPDGARRYGVVTGGDGHTVDDVATQALRKQMAAEAGTPGLFDFGGTVETLRDRCKADTGLEPPRAPAFSRSAADNADRAAKNGALKETVAMHG
ncbi:hydantoinase B/oxoprolinase family protein [Eilatimonas milleporae]|uniref:N-methylhydantoinase B n=1 Tax=Eilatimonas milleporae TaxID=911205 RepID=A0A3M0BTR5_9PROT|nr:hydantoinase B/oxoprolinase family protein [Eilatimonas milleporae]RMB00612.1 N-methylhydantoinase B [Eilatimonas milleporae]